MILQGVAGLAAGIILVTLFSVHYQNVSVKFSPASPPDTPHVLWIPVKRTLIMTGSLQAGQRVTMQR